MNFFDDQMQADGCQPQTAPLLCILLLPLLRTQIGSSYISFSDIGFSFACWFAITGVITLAVMPNDHIQLEMMLHGLLMLLLTVAAVRERARTKLKELSRYTAISRYYSGNPRLSRCLPDPMGWLSRLHGKKPKTAARLIRILIPIYAAQDWLDQRPVWLLKAVFEPLALAILSGICFLLYWYFQVPCLFAGLHLLTVGFFLSIDQMKRSLTLYEEIRANEDGAIVATKMAERLMRRRGP
ncbi:hypothetical protein [Tuwongella immobilis]|uniref:Uncharacterized protein n=1 Tax=Tuwongella immobilis TaxID=692036 RepID=A0A6C2YV16_9BACT|nr:hypothetical protein [Tuwongella immobilis]VIP05346.1 unnamed protein product [Tuwongella immobilis]VTS08048.1 unnamed protein product [Tuwongella immobilis]